MKSINKKIISLKEDKNRGIVNMYFIESYKAYNLLPPEAPANKNASCDNCSIF